MTPPLVWVGHQHRRLIYGIASASRKRQRKADAIRSLHPTFEDLTDVLYRGHGIRLSAATWTSWYRS